MPDYHIIDLCSACSTPGTILIADNIFLLRECQIIYRAAKKLDFFVCSIVRFKHTFKLISTAEWHFILLGLGER